MGDFISILWQGENCWSALDDDLRTFFLFGLRDVYRVPQFEIASGMANSLHRSGRSSQDRLLLHSAVRTANPLDLSELAQPSQGGQTRHEEVLSAAEHVEGFDSVNAAPDRFPRNGETRPFFLQSDNR